MRVAVFGLILAVLVALPAGAEAARIYIPLTSGGAGAIPPTATPWPSTTPLPTATPVPTPAVPIPTSTPVAGWQRSDVVFVFIQGFSSEITPANWDRALGQIRDGLAARGWSTNQFFSYGYRGGVVDNGVWRVNTYSCGDTLQALSTSTFQLENMLYDYLIAHPNTRFVLVGHSLGGTVAWRHLLNQYEGTAFAYHVVGAVTIDSPLQGISSGKSWLGDLGCLLPRSQSSQSLTAIMTDLASIYGTASAQSTYWASAASWIRRTGIALWMFGNVEDCVYYPFGGNCPTPSSVFFFLSDNPMNWSNDRFTQWIDDNAYRAAIPHRSGFTWLDNHGAWLRDPYLSVLVGVIDQAAQPR